MTESTTTARQIILHRTETATIDGLARAISLHAYTLYTNAEALGADDTNESKRARLAKALDGLRSDFRTLDLFLSERGV